MRKNTMLDQSDILQNPYYQTALQATDEAADMVLLSPQELIQTHRYHQNHYSELAAHYCQFATVGNGDSWWIDESLQIFWYDHDQGEPEISLFTPMHIHFRQWLHLRTLHADFERDLDANLNTPQRQARLQTDMNAISPSLAERYPYQY